MPLRRQDFITLAQTLRGNIRNTLSEADNFCTYVALLESRPNSDAAAEVVFDEWLTARSMRLLTAAQGSVNAAAWRVFDTATTINGGLFSPSDFKLFKYRNQSAMRSPVKELEDAQLLITSTDDTDKRRRTIQITPNGWLVARARSRPKP